MPSALFLILNLEPLTLNLVEPLALKVFVVAPAAPLHGLAQKPLRAPCRCALPAAPPCCSCWLCKGCDNPTFLRAGPWSQPLRNASAACSFCYEWTRPVVGDRNLLVEMRSKRLLLVEATLALFLARSEGYSQQLGAYYSGLGMDTLGAGGVNCLFLAFFDPAKMTATNCNFTDPSTPCVSPAPGGGGQGLAWVRRRKLRVGRFCLKSTIAHPPISGRVICRLCCTPARKQHGSHSR